MKSVFLITIILKGLPHVDARFHGVDNKRTTTQVCLYHFPITFVIPRCF